MNIRNIQECQLVNSGQPEPLPVLQGAHAIQIPPAGYAQQGMQVAPRLDKQTDGDLNSLLKATNDDEAPIISTLSSMTDEALISWRSPENNDLSTTIVGFSRPQALEYLLNIRGLFADLNPEFFIHAINSYLNSYSFHLRCNSCPILMPRGTPSKEAITQMTTTLVQILYSKQIPNLTSLLERLSLERYSQSWVGTEKKPSSNIKNLLTEYLTKIDNDIQEEKRNSCTKSSRNV